MARRWRIRHKLVLGLVTALAILGVVLAVTLNGLWDDHVTRKVMERKLEELQAAGPVKNAVLALKKEMEDSEPPRGTVIPREHRLRILMSSPQAMLENLQLKSKQVEIELENFEKEYQTTLQRKLTNDDGILLKQPIEGVREHLANLRRHCKRGLEMLKEDSTAGVMSRGTPRGVQLDPAIKGKIQKSISFLEESANHLQDAIHRGMNDQLKSAKHHYKITIWVLLSTSIFSLLLMVSVLRYFYGWLYNPIRDLLQGVKRVGEANFDHRIEVDSSDEMEELAAAFNDMSYHLNELYRDLERQVNERSRQLVRSERLASVGFLAAGVAHEINNPLASIAFSGEALEARLEELKGPLSAVGRRDDVWLFAKYLRMIQEEANRCSKITERLLEHSRTGDRKREQVDLSELIQSVVDLAKHHQNCRDNQIIYDSPGHVHAWVNLDDIKSVVLNLVVNALESMESKGKLTVELRQHETQAEMLFTDTGCGMDESVVENIFEPFYTQNRSGKGTGLGLTIAHRIISQHGGEIEASSPGVNQGSTFRVLLPLQAADNAREESKNYAA